MKGENTRRRGSILVTGYVEAKATGLRIASVKLAVSIYSKPQKPREVGRFYHHV
ncbi:hypothetical protein SAMN05216192_1053 [Paenibacillus typhae]|uniref:Uncharacterized protein n=1 Tax=Paenibacillus typhae TaxID=1174501 RepID=A0A1G8K1E5_9BACL|nr:hypothetical protein SAMN05216192_1053 [Paenibacillus typhae]